MTPSRLAAALLLGLTLVAGRASATVDLNKATAEELETLPGIGSARAQAILKRRSEKGPFKAVEELREIKGIGPALLEKLRPHVALGAAQQPAAAARPAEPERPAQPPPAPAREKSAPPAKERAAAAKSERRTAAPGPLDDESPQGKINLNLAAESELEQLQGITPANAKVIVAWRRAKGPFLSVNDLERIPGLPAGVFETAKYFVTARADANEVGVQQLVALGVSQEGAEAMVAARRKKGGFRAASDLQLVPGLAVEEREAVRPLLWFPGGTAKKR